jgi:translation initiation factor 2 subunit 1
MKSKAVASILRHVASKVSSVSGSTAADGDSSGAQKEGAHPVDQAAEKEIKKAARKARQAAAHGEDTTSAVVVEGDHGIPGGGNEEEKLEQLYEQIGWPLGKKYGHPYDAFKLALTYVHFELIFLFPPT